MSLHSLWNRKRRKCILGSVREMKGCCISVTWRRVRRVSAEHLKTSHKLTQKIYGADLGRNEKVAKSLMFEFESHQTKVNGLSYIRCKVHKAFEQWVNPFLSTFDIFAQVNTENLARVLHTRYKLIKRAQIGQVFALETLEVWSKHSFTFHHQLTYFQEKTKNIYSSERDINIFCKFIFINSIFIPKTQCICIQRSLQFLIQQIHFTIPRHFVSRYF